MNPLISKADANPLDFSPPILRLQDSPPNPLGRKVLWSLLALLFALILWALIGKLDIVAVAEGKLIPETYLKIVQPAEAGIVKDILVREGQNVKAGQVLLRIGAPDLGQGLNIAAAQITAEALGLDLWFVTGEGPRLSTVTDAAGVAALKPVEAIHDTLSPIYETVRILSRELLIDWTRGGHASPVDRVIDVQMSRLRRKLGDDPREPVMIRTVRGDGYLFAPAVTRC